MKGIELFIDFTFSNILSVLVSEDDDIKFFISVSSSTHVSKFLPVFVKEALGEFSSLSGIYIAKGPGSFTALRILISYIKGIYVATSVPVFTYNSTDWMAYYIVQNRKYVSENFSIGFYSGAKNFYYLTEYEMKNGIPTLRSSKITENRDEINFSDEDIQKELGAKYIFYLHLKQAPQKPDIKSLQPLYIFQEILQISKKQS